MEFAQIAQQLGITPSRLSTISNELFGERKPSFEEAEFKQIQGTVEVLRLHQERSVKRAVQLYREGAAVANRVDPRQSAASNPHPTTVPKVQGLGASSQNASEIARQLAAQEVGAIIEYKNRLVADWLSNGIPVDALSELALDRLQASEDLVYHATVEKIDSVGNFLPAVVEAFQPRMLSAAID